mmetsp:Transcript_16839/g.34828  ORF Transcript_16839/g.34828 Transcript_16839/m.34828 type:complete len:82 (+) Transcript_16839:1710-1955(+)
MTMVGVPLTNLGVTQSTDFRHQARITCVQDIHGTDVIGAEIRRTNLTFRRALMRQVEGHSRLPFLPFVGPLERRAKSILMN